MTAPLPPDPADVLTRLEELHKAAWEEVFGLCNGSRRWTMRVPVDEARDSDEVIGAALNAGEAAVAAVRRVLALAEELEQRADDFRWAQSGSYDDGVNVAFTHTADRLRRALAGPDDTQQDGAR